MKEEQSNTWPTLRLDITLKHFTHIFPWWHVGDLNLLCAAHTQEAVFDQIRKKWLSFSSMYELLMHVFHSNLQQYVSCIHCFFNKYVRSQEMFAVWSPFASFSVLIPLLSWCLYSKQLIQTPVKPLKVFHVVNKNKQIMWLSLDLYVTYPTDFAAASKHKGYSCRCIYIFFKISTRACEQSVSEQRVS